MKKLLFAIAAFILYASAYAQITTGTCAIRYTYDNAGNRISRDYFCMPGIISGTGSSNVSYQVVTSVRPNPTTGIVDVFFSQSLSNGNIKITDARGVVILQTKAKGQKTTFNLSQHAAGIYFVEVKSGSSKVVFKIDKQ